MASNIVFIQLDWRQDRILYILPDYSLCCELQFKGHGAGFFFFARADRHSNEQLISFPRKKPKGLYSEAPTVKRTLIS